METFEQACPYYMMFGMTYEQYWNGDVSAHKAYRKRYLLEDEQRKTSQNLSAWLNGLYVARAIGSAFNGKKSAYPNEPIKLFTTMEERREEKRLEKEAAAMNRAKTNMEIFMVNFNNRMNAKLDGKEGNKVASDSTGN